MAYITGSLTDANPGPALHTLMATALTTAGYTLVDTVTISTRTHKVWKSPAAGNVQNLDWYLDIGYTTTGAGTVALAAFEMFDPATDLGYRGSFVSSETTIDPVTSSRYGATGYALETNWFGAHSANLQTSITTTAFGYWITVTADRVVLLCSNAPTMPMYAGLYQPDALYAAKAGSLLYPLVVGRINLGDSAATSLALTRIPPWTALTTSTRWNYTVGVAPVPNLGQWPMVPTGATTSYPYVAMPVQLLSSPGQTFNGGRWGWFRDVFIVPSGGVTRGDTCTIDGTQCILSSAASSFSWAFKAV